MGCGGSRADAVDPRWQESWTGETESTWLTTTDTEPTQVASGSGPNSGNLALGLEPATLRLQVP
uniref:BAALC binder of MAP3K1 and KLF4 b n=1 Tax=Electrophorus electricus TaxID=8005 RepID=A0A4W4FCD6_ELEEL